MSANKRVPATFGLGQRRAQLLDAIIDIRRQLADAVIDVPVFVTHRYRARRTHADLRAGTPTGSIFFVFRIPVRSLEVDPDLVLFGFQVVALALRRLLRPFSPHSSTIAWYPGGARKRSARASPGSVENANSPKCFFDNLFRLGNREIVYFFMQDTTLYRFHRSLSVIPAPRLLQFLEICS